MRYVSTRGESPAVTLADAIRRGLAPDGGLYLPADVQDMGESFWSSVSGKTLPSLATELLAPFTGDELTREDLFGLLAAALNFPIPLVRLGPRTWLLELFHGPTLAFKDVGARCLAHFLARLRPPGAPLVTVVVATSGDTGGAVAHAFNGVAGTQVVVLYPEGQVSPCQERQFATLGGNVQAIAVEGKFDDCQRLAKEVLGDRRLTDRHGLTSANSINVGRLLPQMVYYAWARAQLPPSAPPPVFCVPSGNFGNLAAGLMIQRMGLPCGRFVAGTNANDVVPEFLDTGQFRPRTSRRTLATAMDVGNPSNLARIRALFGDDLETIRRAVWASSHGDDEICSAIRDIYEETGTLVDPHTAVGYLALRRYLQEDVDCSVAIVLATAHPAKFAEVVEPIVGFRLSLPEPLAACLEKPLQKTVIPPRSEALRQLLSDRVD